MTTSFPKTRVPGFFSRWPMPLTASVSTARAAECLRESNSLSIETNRTGKTTRPADHEKFVDGLIRSFDRDFFARLAGAGLADAKAGLRVRPAALGYDARRAGARQSFAGPWRG